VYCVSKVFKFTVRTILFLVLAVLIIEAVLFVFEDTFFRSAFYGFDPDIGFRVRPYAHWGPNTANRFGFNDVDHELKKPPGNYRLLFLGDSFNWTGGLKTNYTALIQKNLMREEKSRHITVLNAGYPMIHPGEGFQVLKKFGMQYHPDCVVLSVYAGNDFYDANPMRKRVCIGCTCVDVDLSKHGVPMLFGHALLPHSRFLLLFKNQWMQRKYTILHQPVKEGDTPHYNKAFLNLVYARMDFTHIEHRHKYDSHIDLVKHTIIDMREFLERNGVAFRVLVFPAEFQVSRDLQTAILQSTGTNADAYDWLLPQALIEAVCLENKIDSLDLTPAFRSATLAGDRLYRLNDPHFNAAGNRLAAEETAPWIRQFLDLEDSQACCTGSSLIVK
jgi:hypothetical protein